MSSELFENYEFEFSQLSAKITNKLNSQIPNFAGEQKKSAIRVVQQELEQLAEIVSGMELEIKNQPVQYRQRLTTKTRTYKSELDKLSKEVRGLSSSSARVDLLGAPGGGNREEDLEAATTDQRGRILAGSDKLNRTTDRLNNAQRIAVESEIIGTDILGELDTQRQAIVRTRNQLYKTDDNLGTSRRLLNAMYYRIIQSRVIMIAIIVILLGILGVVVYMRFFK